MKYVKGRSPGIICSNIITGLDLTHPVAAYPMQHDCDFLQHIFHFRKFPGKEYLFSESLKSGHLNSALFACEHA